MTKLKRSLRTGCALLVAAMALTACDDPFENRPWSAEPDTVRLFSAARVEYAGMPSAIDFTGTSGPGCGTPCGVAIDATGAAGAWDFLLNEEDGSLVLVPSSIVPGLESRAAIALSEQTTLEAVERAPDAGEFTTDPATLVPDAVYVVRSRRAGCAFTTGSFYGKMKVVSIDAARGIAVVEAVRNPYCDDRDLIPPDDD